MQQIPQIRVFGLASRGSRVGNAAWWCGLSSGTEKKSQHFSLVARGGIFIKNHMPSALRFRSGFSHSQKFLSHTSAARGGLYGAGRYGLGRGGVLGKNPTQSS